MDREEKRELQKALAILSKLVETDVTRPKRTWSERSEKAMAGVHSDLRRLAKEVLQSSPLDIMIIEGLRSKDRQSQLVKRGASQTMKSYHLVGRAIDFVPIVDGEPSWHWQDFNSVGPVWEQWARLLDIKITWGGRWEHFKDGAHIQLEPYEENLF